MPATHDYAGIAANTTIKSKAEVHSYEDAERFLGTANVRQIASNVQIIRRSPTSIAVRLYATDILTYHSDGTFEADNGGYNTPTTAARAQQFGPKGYQFYHKSKRLCANGRPTGPGVRLPTVITR